MTVGYVSEGGFTRLQQLLANHRARQAPRTITQAELVALQQAVGQIPIPGRSSTRSPNSAATAQRDSRATGAGGKLMASCAPTRLLEGRSAVEEDDLAILKHVLWSSPDQQAEISKLCARLSNPINGKATELTDQAASVYDATMVAHGQSGDTQQKVVVVAEGIDKLKAINAGLVQLQEQAAAKGRATGKIEKAIASVQEMREKVGALILGAM